MKKYYLYDGVTQHGPFEFEELKSKNINADTSVWFDPMPDWKPAGEIEELKPLFEHAPPPFHAHNGSVVATTIAAAATSVASPVSAAVAEPEVIVPVEPIRKIEAVPVVKLESTAPVVVAQPAAASRLVKPPVRNTAWLSYLLSLIVLAGAGYFVYTDVNKGKNDTPALQSINTNSDGSSVSRDSSAGLPGSKLATESAIDTVEATKDAVVQPDAIKAKINATLVAERKKAEAEKKKLEEKKNQEELQNLEAKRKLDEKKSNEAALAKSMQIRNGWSNYITIGSLNYKPKNDGISAFEIPVQNSTDALIDKVMIRIDYYKKEGKEKPMKSENIVVTNIPARSGIAGMAPENKRCKKVNVFITGVISKKLHFCYPQNNGNPADPYFCN